MYKSVGTLVGAGLVTVAIVGATSLPGRAASPFAPIRPLAGHPPPASGNNQRAVIEEFCLTCHDNDKMKGDLTLETFDPAKADERGEIAEKMIRKLRAGMMPPPVPSVRPRRRLTHSPRRSKRSSMRPPSSSRIRAAARSSG